MPVIVTAKQTEKDGFCINAFSTNSSAGHTVLAAVSGKSHYIKSINITCNTAITATITDGAGVIFVGPVPFSTTGNSPYKVTFNKAVKATENQGLIVTTSGSGGIVTVIQGYTE